LQRHSLQAAHHVPRRLEDFVQRLVTVELSADDDLAHPTKREIALGFVRILAGLAGLVGIVALAGFRWRSELEHFGRWFVERFGAPGMAGGAFLADGLHFPLPPQFYLFTGIAGGYGTVPALACVLAGSIAGGFVAFALARRASGIPFFERRFSTTRHILRRLLRARGRWGLVIAGLLPVSYFVLCVLGGMMGLRYRDYAILGLMRIPRLVLSFLLIVLAWGG
jgi:membrane protein YqaA with SNARE-associated domain